MLFEKIAYLLTLLKTETFVNDDYGKTSNICADILP